MINKNVSNTCDRNSIETKPVAGNIKNYLPEWEKLTNDKNVLNLVTSYDIELENMPIQKIEPHPINFSQEEKTFVANEIEKLLEKGVIKLSEEEREQYVSNIFLRPKKDNSYRMILNLKILNQDIQHHHFKMDSIQTCIDLMVPDGYMASLDLKDAY